MTLVLRTPAKLNVGLEVLGRRPDGFHDLATVFQAVDIYDEFHLTPGSEFAYIGDPAIPPGDDIVRPILEQAAGKHGWTGTMRLVKHIPVSAGLGGGSSDAALALRLCHAGSGAQPDVREAARIGADVPFFLRGGTARATGIGDRLSPLPTPELWFVVHTPAVNIPQKTRQLFAGLRPADMSDGSYVDRIARLIGQGDEALPDTLPNAFEAQMRQIPTVEFAWNTLGRVAGRVALTGAGPSLFSWHRAPERAWAVCQAMRERLPGWTKVCIALEPHDDDDDLIEFYDRLTGDWTNHRRTPGPTQ